MNLHKRALRYNETTTYNCSCGQYGLINGKVTRGLRKWPATECEAELIEDGNEGNRVTATRVAAGALLAGPVGAVVGGLAKKSNETGWLVVTTPDGEGRIKLSGRGVAKARTFVMNLGMEQKRTQGQVQA